MTQVLQSLAHLQRFLTVTCSLLSSRVEAASTTATPRQPGKRHTCVCVCVCVCSCVCARHLPSACSFGLGLDLGNVCFCRGLGFTRVACNTLDFVRDFLLRLLPRYGSHLLPMAFHVLPDTQPHSHTHTVFVSKVERGRPQR